MTDGSEPISQGGPEPKPRPPVHRLRRRSRRLARWLAIGFVGTLVTSVIVLTQTGVTRSYVLPKVASLLPGEVTAGGVHLGLNGDVVIENLLLRAPGVPGEPSEFFRTKKLRVALDLFSLRSDHPRALSLTLVEPVARVSVDKRTNAMNLASVVWPGGAGGGDLPKVFVKRGIIELGEHEGSTYDVLRRVRVDGELAPSKDGDHSYTLSAREIGRVQQITDAAGADTTGFIVDGKISPSAIELTLKRLQLADWGPESVPTIFRDVMRRLAIDGTVEQATLDYDFKQGLSASLALRGVGMNLPVSGEEAAASGHATVIDQSHPAMRMRNVTGTIDLSKGKIEARATGNLEELPYNVRLQYMGASADAPFVLELNAEGFELRQHPNVLRFAPEVARHWAEQFSNPTGIFDTWVEVSRGPGEDGQPGKIAVRGRAKFRGTTAAFFKFPYQFDDMSGTFYFDDNAIEMRDIQGRSAQGATVHASGIIAPPNELADVKLDIRVKGAPIDKALLEAIGPVRRQLIDDLVSRAVYDDMFARGLIKRAENIDQVIDSPSDPTSDQPPAFALGGKADVTVLISRDLGKDTAWHDEVEVSIPRVGMLPEKFRYPIIGEDVKLRIAKSKAEVIGGRFRGLHGGSAELDATVVLPDTADVNGKVSAEVDVRAKGVPFDSLLLYAIPDSPISGLTGEAHSVRQMVDLLRLSGTLDCTAHIGDGPDGELGYKISVATKDATAAPTRLAAPTGLTLRGLSGSVEVEPTRVGVTLAGEAMHGDASAGVLNVAVEAALGAAVKDHAAVKATLDVRGLDVGAPIQDLAAIFSLDATQKILDVREAVTPAGRLGVKVDLAAPVGEAAGPWVGSLIADQADGFSFAIPEGRVTLSDSTGRVVVTGGEQTSVRFEDFDAQLSDLEGSIGRVGASGLVHVIDGAPKLDAAGLVVSATGLKIESPLTRALVEKRVGDQVAALYREHNPAGRIDARLTLAPAGDGPRLAHGWIGPRALAFDIGGQRVDFPTAGGRFELQDTGGTFVGVELNAADWSVKADGAWTMKATTGAGDRELEQVEAKYEVDSKGLPPDLMAALPPDVSGVLRDLDAGADGRVKIKQGTLSIQRGKAPAAAPIANVAAVSPSKSAPAAAPASALGVIAHGVIELEKARLNVGVPISECDGSVRFDVDRPAGASPNFNFAGDFTSLRISGVRMTEGLVRFESGAEPGRVKIPLISATCHGGRLAGDARIVPGDGKERLFDARIQISGARFGPLLADLREGAGKPEKVKPGASKKPEDDPEARGALDAELTLSGIVGDAGSRRGRGSARIGGGRVVSMPLTMALIRFSNFQLPLDERLALAKASFYIDGGIIGFDELAIYSRSIEISGGGTMTWPDTALDMRFNSRSLVRVPVISELIEGIRDNLITTRVRGTLDDPDIGVAAPGEAKALDRAPSISPGDEAGKDVAPTPAPGGKPPPASPKGK